MFIPRLGHLVSSVMNAPPLDRGLIKVQIPFDQQKS
jgi:hypothetical protein